MMGIQPSQPVQMDMGWYLTSLLIGTVVNEAEVRIKAIHESFVGDDRNPRRRGLGETGNLIVKGGRGAGAERDALVDKGDCNCLSAELCLFQFVNAVSWIWFPLSNALVLTALVACKVSSPEYIYMHCV
jgi:hypothetical protein